MSFNTGNPMGSTDARDLYDNAQNLDNATNGAAAAWTDRLGVERKSFAGMEADFQAFLAGSGYEDLGTYAADLDITSRNQIFVHEGEYYRAAAATVLPYTTTGTWATDDQDFVAMGDAVIRQDLALTPDTVIGSYRNAVNCNQYGGLEAALADSDTLGKIIVVTDAQAISEDATVTGRKLTVEYGGLITVASTKTLNANGNFISAGDYQVFAGSGTVTLTGDTKLVWFGDTVAAWDRSVVATPTGSVMHVTENIAFSSVATVNKNIGVVMAPGVALTRTGAGVGIDFTGQLQKAKIDVTVTRTADWTAGNYGVQFKDTISSDITVDVYGFNRGISIVCPTGATVYDNQIRLKQLFTNQHGVWVEQTGTGSVNANNFWGGRWSEAGTHDDSVNRYGIYLKGGVGTNKFWGPLIEILNVGGTGTTYTMYCEDSRYNHIIEGYFEAQDYIIGASGDSYYNSAEGSAGLAAAYAPPESQIDETTCNFPGTNTVEWSQVRNSNAAQLGTQKVFDVEDIVRNTIYNSVAGDNYVVSGFTFLPETGVFAATNTSCKLNEQALYLNRTAIGRWVDTSVIKNFWLAIGKLSTSTLAVYVAAFDAAGARLYTGTDVQGASRDLDAQYPFVPVADFGNVYANSGHNGTMPDVVFFNVKDAVKSIWVGVRNSENSGLTPITGLSLKCVGSTVAPNSNAGYDLVSAGNYDLTGVLGALVEPVGGVFNNGTKISHLDGAVGEPSGWNITNRRSTTTTTGEPAAETVVAVTAITGVASGDVFGVIITADADASTKWHWTSVNGAPGGGNITMTAAVPTGYTIAAGARVISWKPKALANI